MPENNATYDLVIIGSGPGGYVAAVHAAQLGLKVACVEKEERLGGVCLNVGCIPSKALLDSSEYYYLAKHQFAEHGIKTGRLGIDLAAMMTRKEKVVAELTDNVRKLLQRNKIEIIHGHARLGGPQQVVVDQPEKEPLVLEAKAILLATGSEPVEVPGMAFDGKRIISSTEVLSLDAIPKQIGVVGGGYIGLELGSVWNRLGTQVTVIEMLPQVATGLDGQIARTLKRILAKQGLDFRLKSKVTSATVKGKKVLVTIDTPKGQEELTFDRLLVAVGRKPLTRDLGLEEAGVTVDLQTGRIPVDAAYRTNIASIYAIGDLIPGPMLAHKASAEGIAAVAGLAGQTGEVNYDAIPAIVYTAPETAGVGKTEQEVKDLGIDYRTGTYPFAGTGRARCLGETEGFVKIICQAKTDRILGVHIIGPHAADMIAECTLAMEFGAGSEDVARTVHGHPTFSEAIMEAAMAVR